MLDSAEALFFCCCDDPAVDDEARGRVGVIGIDSENAAQRCSFKCVDHDSRSEAT
jgi:hypothetical protein